jgi:hypothetical protein
MAAASLLLPLLAALASAPDLAGDLPPGAKWHPEVGAWVRYRVEGSSKIPTARVLYVTFGILGKERVKGHEAFWVQCFFGTQPEGGAIAYKMLLGGDPRDERRTVVRQVVRYAGAEAIEMEPAKPEAPSHDGEDADPAEEPSVSEEAVMTHAGSIPAVKVSLSHGAVYWYSEKVPILALARAKMANGTTFELDAFSKSGAVDRVGEPRNKTPVSATSGRMPP